MENDDNNNRRRQLPPRYPFSVNFPSCQPSTSPLLSYANPAPSTPRFTSGYGSGWNISSYQMPVPPVTAAPLFTSGFGSGWNRSSFQMPMPPVTAAPLFTSGFGSGWNRSSSSFQMPAPPVTTAPLFTTGYGSGCNMSSFQMPPPPRLPSFTPSGTFSFQGSSLSALTMSIPLSPLPPTTTALTMSIPRTSASSFLHGLFFLPPSFNSTGPGQLGGRAGLYAPTCSPPLATFLDEHSSTPRLLPLPSPRLSPFASNFRSGDGEYELPPLPPSLDPTSTDMESGDYELPPLPPSLPPTSTDMESGDYELPLLPPSLPPSATNFESGEYELPPSLSPSNTNIRSGEDELPALPPSLAPTHSATNFGGGEYELPPLPPSLPPAPVAEPMDDTATGSIDDMLMDFADLLEENPSGADGTGDGGDAAMSFDPEPSSLGTTNSTLVSPGQPGGNFDTMGNLLLSTGAGGPAGSSIDPEPSSMGATNTTLISPGQYLGATNTTLDLIVSPRQNQGATNTTLIVSPGQNLGATNTTLIVRPGQNLGATNTTLIVSPGQNLGATNTTLVSPGLPGGNIDFETLGNLLLLSTGAGGVAGASSSSRSAAESWEEGQLVPWFADGTFTLEEVSKIMADSRLKEIVLTNPKEVRRVLGRRRSYHKSICTKAKRAAELEAESRQLRSQNESIAAHLQAMEYATAMLQIDNNRQRRSRVGLEQRHQLMDAILESHSANMHSETQNAGMAIGYNPPVNSLNPGIGAQTVLEQPNIPALMETPTADMYRGNLGAPMNIGSDNPSSSNQEIGIPWVFPDQLDTYGESSRRQEDQDKDGTSKHS